MRLELATIFAVSLLAACGGPTPYQFERSSEPVQVDEWVVTPHEDLVEAAFEFAGAFVGAYTTAVQQSVPYPARSDIQLMAAGSIGADIIVSTTAEAVISLCPAATADATIRVTAWPAQLAVFGAPPAPLARTGLAEVVAKYETRGALFPAIPGAWTTIEEMRMTNTRSWGKLFQLSPKSGGVVLLDTQVLAGDHDDSAYLPGSEDCVVLLLGYNDLRQHIDAATARGEVLATMEIGEQFRHSPAFRRVLASEFLRPRALEIERKLSRHAEDPAFTYPLWQLRADVAELVQEIEELQLEDGDALLEELRTHVRLEIHDGVFFWYYDSVKGFAIQWACFIVAQCLVALLLRSAAACPLAAPLARAVAVGMYGLIPLVNIWAFNQRPPSFPVLLALPLAIGAVVALLLTHWARMAPRLNVRVDDTMDD